MEFFFYLFFLFFAWIGFSELPLNQGIPLYYWDSRIDRDFVNFGDVLSEKIVERIVGHPILVTFNPFYGFHCRGRKMLALGSIMHRAEQNDVIWGTGVYHEEIERSAYRFYHLDVRGVRGPLTRKILMSFGIQCPEVYGDPALLIPRLFPEFKRAENPSREYILIPHFMDTFFCLTDPHVVSVKGKWDDIIRKILDSRFVISSSLHGIIVAEAFGIPARYLRVSDHEPLFKYQDYYYGTNRPNFKYAMSLEEAFEMGGEEPFQCDLDQLLRAFPFELFPAFIPVPVESHSRGPN